MKLSEAMRAGAALRPQAFHGLFDTDEQTGVVCSCALGAAYEGRFGRVPDLDDTDELQGAYDDLRAVYPALYDDAPPVGLLACGMDSLMWRIIKLNDEQRLSRERIADELEKAGL